MPTKFAFSSSIMTVAPWGANADSRSGTACRPAGDHRRRVQIAVAGHDARVTGSRPVASPGPTVTISRPTRPASRLAPKLVELVDRDRQGPPQGFASVMAAPARRARSASGRSKSTSVGSPRIAANATGPHSGTPAVGSARRPRRTSPPARFRADGRPARRRRPRQWNTNEYSGVRVKTHRHAVEDGEQPDRFALDAGLLGDLLGGDLGGRVRRCRPNPLGTARRPSRARCTSRISPVVVADDGPHRNLGVT